MRGWLAKSAPISIALCLFVPNLPTRSEETLWRKSVNEAKQLRAQGRYVEAERLHLLAQAEAEKFGPEDRRLALSLNELAVLYHSRGQLTEAEPLYRRSLAIWEKGSEPLEVATLLNNLTRLCLDQERYEEVEFPAKRALAILQSLGPNNPAVANSLNNLADLHAIRRRYSEAEPLYRQASTILEKAVGPEHPEVAYGLNHLGKLYYREARYAEAEALHRRAIATLQKTPGQMDAVLASSLNDLADLVVDQGRNTEAEALYQQAQTIWERVLGPEHPNVALCLGNRARFYKKQGWLAEAEPLYQQALAIWEKTQGPEHLNVGNGLGNLDSFTWCRDAIWKRSHCSNAHSEFRQEKLEPSIPTWQQLSMLWQLSVELRAATRKRSVSSGELSRPEKGSLDNSNLQWQPSRVTWLRSAACWAD